MRLPAVLAALVLALQPMPSHATDTVRVGVPSPSFTFAPFFVGLRAGILLKGRLLRLGDCRVSAGFQCFVCQSGSLFFGNFAAFGALTLQAPAALPMVRTFPDRVKPPTYAVTQGCASLHSDSLKRHR